MKSESTKDYQLVKLLLLGAGQSGKSTLFKQMIKIYGKGFSDQERQTFKPIIHNNILISMKMLCLQSEAFGPVSIASTPSKKFIDELKDEQTLTPKIAEHVAILWADEGIKKTYENRGKFQIGDSTQYFMDKLKEVANPEYIPDYQDVLRARAQTRAIVEHRFVIEGCNFLMIDVGGQRALRRNWLHCFENVTAVMFVAAISEYDQMLEEDETVNRLDDAMKLFGEICNSRWFIKTSMILFLNKHDILAEKLPKVPLGNHVPEYKGDNSYESAAEYLQNAFLSKNRKEKTIYSHITCATNTQNITVVFNVVLDIIIRGNIKACGLE